MGIYNNGALGTLINSRHILPIPDHWTMEEAATVLVTYGTVLEILFSVSILCVQQVHNTRRKIIF